MVVKQGWYANKQPDPTYNGKYRIEFENLSAYTMRRVVRPVLKRKGYDPGGPNTVRVSASFKEFNAPASAFDIASALWTGFTFTILPGRLYRKATRATFEVTYPDGSLNNHSYDVRYSAWVWLPFVFASGERQKIEKIKQDLVFRLINDIEQDLANGPGGERNNRLIRLRDGRTFYFARVVDDENGKSIVYPGGRTRIDADEIESARTLRPR
jgi:hypothetical protein